LHSLLNMSADEQTAGPTAAIAHRWAVRCIAAFAAALLLGSGTLVSAQESAEHRGYLTDRYSLTLGFYELRPETTVRLDALGGRLGTTLNLEDDLGIKSEATAQDFSFGARIGRRHRVELERFGVDREGRRDNTRQIVVGNDTYDVGVVLDSEFDMDVTRVGYAYSFLRDDKKEVGVHVGVHITELAFRVTAELQPITSATQEIAETTAPLPVIGAQGGFRFLPRWTLHGRAQIFRLTAGDYDGEIDHLAIAFEHSTFKRVGLGVALDFFRLNLDSKDDSFLGSFELKFAGPRIFAHAHF